MTMVLAYRPVLMQTLLWERRPAMLRWQSPRVMAKGAQDGDPEGGKKLSEIHHAASTLA
jgi:hypothetical protein